MRHFADGSLWRRCRSFAIRTQASTTARHRAWWSASALPLRRRIKPTSGRWCHWSPSVSEPDDSPDPYERPSLRGRAPLSLRSDRPCEAASRRVHPHPSRGAQMVSDPPASLTAVRFPANVSRTSENRRGSPNNESRRVQRRTSETPRTEGKNRETSATLIPEERPSSRGRVTKGPPTQPISRTKCCQNPPLS